jgi:hypothetical protein
MGACKSEVSSTNISFALSPRGLRPPNPQQLTEFHPADLLPVEEIAKRLHVEVTWVREKVRRRSPNPIPCYNLGRHLLFSWPDVSNWIRETGRGVAHMKHHRTRRIHVAKATA